MGLQQSSRFKNENQLQTLQNASNKKKYITGDHETHLSDAFEGELHTRNAVCEKNPGHSEFIPVDKFTFEHMPKGQRDNDLYEYIKAVADLTVKVNVEMVSPHRPEFWPETYESYPFYNMRGQGDCRTGSGMTGFVYKYMHGVNYFKKCWCRKCEHSDSPGNVWWEFFVITATHVVFDDIEASYATLKLFYDNKDSSVTIIHKVIVDDVNVERDRCWLKCVTCDTSLGDKLEKMWKHYEKVERIVRKRYKTSRSVKKFSFIVSHPHGCFKQISFGQWIKKYKIDSFNRKFTYTTCTCPGSSGATVYCVGYMKRWLWFYPELVHCGTKDKYNYSGVGW